MRVNMSSASGTDTSTPWMLAPITAALGTVFTCFSPEHRFARKRAPTQIAGALTDGL